MNCDRCNEPLIEIEHYGEQLVGCIECNCWRGERSAFIVDLSIEDVQALRDGRQTRSIRRPNAAGNRPFMAPNDFMFYSAVHPHLAVPARWAAFEVLCKS